MEIIIYRPREVTIHITVVQSTERGNNSFESTQAISELKSDLYSQLLLISSVQVIEITRYGWYIIIYDGHRNS